jgi:hypothetical protein
LLFRATTGLWWARVALNLLFNGVAKTEAAYAEASAAAAASEHT